jgi:hypothetical protein
MNYEIAFYVLVAFLVGRFMPRKIYIGNDERKYKEADAGILLRRQPISTTENKPTHNT